MCADNLKIVEDFEKPEALIRLKLLSVNSVHQSGRWATYLYAIILLSDVGAFRGNVSSCGHSNGLFDETGLSNTCT